MVLPKRISRWSETTQSRAFQKDNKKEPYALSADLSKRRNPTAPNSTGTKTPKTSRQFPFPASHERWESLSAQFEGLAQFWIRRLQKNTDEEATRGEPGITNNIDQLRLYRQQVQDLSAAGDNLFKAVVEMQRLRVSSEKKYQRWFFETRAELAGSGEAKAALEHALTQERGRAAGLAADLAALALVKGKPEEGEVERGKEDKFLTERIEVLQYQLRREHERVTDLSGILKNRGVFPFSAAERTLREAREGEGSALAALKVDMARERKVARDLQVQLADERHSREAIQEQLDKERGRRERAVRHLMGNGSNVSAS